MNEELVKQLERLLEEAKAGELLEIAYGGIRKNGSYAVGWSTPDHSVETMGALTLTQSFMAKTVLDLGTKVDMFS